MSRAASSDRKHVTNNEAVSSNIFMMAAMMVCNGGEVEQNGYVMSRKAFVEHDV